MKQRLVLFDVDDTLIVAPKYTHRFDIAVEEVFHVKGSRDGAKPGLTDVGLLAYVAKSAGIGEDQVIANLDKLEQVSERVLTEMLKNTKIEKQKGTDELIETLKKKGYIIGLMTGNTMNGARIKLENAGYDFSQFEVGAFGDKEIDRARLLTNATVKWLTEYDLDKRHIYYFGDTSGDINAGKAAGVVTITVGTGNQTLEELAMYEPDYMMPDMTDTKSIMSIIEG